MTTQPPPGRLPRDRQLSEQHSRVDRIIAEVGRPQRIGRRRIGYAIAAAAAVILALVGAGIVLRPTDPGVIATPQPTGAPSTGASPSRPGETGPLGIGDRADLKYVKITPTDVIQTPRGLAIEVEACVTGIPPAADSGKISMGWHAWSIIQGARSYSVQAFAMEDVGFPAFLPVTAPIGVGECTEGWLPFAGITQDDQVTDLVYRDRFGDVAYWTID